VKIVRLLKWVLFSLLLLIAALALLLTTESGFRLLLRTCDSFAGPTFSVEQVQGRFLDSWRLEKVQLHINGVVDVTLDELGCSWSPMALVDKKLQVDRIKAKGLVLRLAATGNETTDSSPIVLPDIHFPLGLRVEDLQVHDAGIYFPGSSEPFVVNELVLQVSAHDDQVVIERLKLDTPDYGADLQANVQLSATWPLAISGDWRVNDPGIGDLSGSIEAGGDLETLAVSASLKTPAAAKVQGQLIGILDDLHWKATGETEHFQLGDIQVDLPVDGTLTVIEASGTIESYGGTVAADIHYQGYPRVQARAEVQGDYNGLTIQSLRLLLDEARLTARGRIGWVDGFSWQAELEAEQLDPAQFVSGWPGEIDTLLHSQGKWAADKLTADLKIDRLQGELRGFPLAGSGRAGIDGKTFTVDALHLQSGSTHFRVNGRVNSELDLTFQAGSDDLASLLPESSGVFQLQGTVSGSREQPSLSMTLDGSELKVQEYSVQSLKAGVKADLAVAGSIDAEVEAGGVRVKGETISTARLQVLGNREKHRMDLSLAGSLGALQLVVAGGLQEREWQGELSELLLQTSQFGEWKIQKPIIMHLSEKNCEVSEFYLVQDQVWISLAGKWQQQRGWQLQGGVEHFPLNLLEEWDLLTQKLDGVFTASVMATGQGTIPDQAEIVVSVPDLSLTAEDEDGEIRSWHWTDNNFQARLENSEARVTAQTLFQDGSVAKLEVIVGNCNDFTKPGEMTIEGKLDLNLNDLSPLAPLSGYMVNGEGRFTGSCVLQGTVARPSLQGRMALEDGEIQIPDAGIVVQELELSVAGDTTANRVELTLVSGGGRLKAEGVVKQSLQKQWQADFTIKGKDFQAVDLSEYKALISPDLHFVYGKAGIALSGTVTVAKAGIAPTGFQGSVSASRDVILLDADDDREKNTLPLSLDLAVVMGKEVEIDAFGVKGHLDGTLKISQEPGQAITGLGSLNLSDGTFTFKGTSLKINRGLVFYQGGPIDDPGLDVQAVKEVDDKEVGVQLTGSVSRMEMKLFSTPTMDDSDILAYLLVGHDMSTSNEQEGSMLGAAAATLGIGKGGSFLSSIEKETGLDVSLAGGEKASDISLVIGKEIYKDLYISYGKGLTDSEGTFKARYNLKHGFSVETEATSEASGADLFWSLER
jgi:translocation and assembly module TamB